MYDVVVQNGLVAMDSGIMPVNLGITGSHIAEIAAIPLAGKHVIDAKGAVVAPGWIDSHSHLEGHAYAGQLALLQGITTSVGGNCGFGPPDMAAFLQAQRGYYFHQAEFAGHATLREQVGVSDVMAAASPAQIQAMRRLAQAALDAGACGISFGMGYTPGASQQEFLALAEVARDAGRMVSVDVRLSHLTDLEGLRDALEVARCGVRMQISHFVYQHSATPDTMQAACVMMDAAEAQGLDVWMDSGMYTWWTSVIGTSLFDEMFMYSGAVTWGEFTVCTGPHAGEVWDEALYRHMRQAHAEDSVVSQAPGEAYVLPLLSRARCMPSCDAGRYAVGQGHPQGAGTFPRYVRHVLDAGIPLADIIAKATALPAQVFGLTHKGHIAVGYDADVVIFRPECIQDRAWYLPEGKPDTPPAGIDYVLVAGQVAVTHGKIVQEHAGDALVYGREESYEHTGFFT